jgi:CheY-like chemotaxis protein
VRVRSRPGRGTVFEIGLPIAFTEPEQSSDAGLAPLLDGRLVLLIDDDPMVLKNMADLLTGFNCQVITASSLTDALRAVDQCLRLPDLIITDFHLGRDSTGVDAVSRVRALAEEDIPAVLVTTHPAAASNSERLPILTKPLRTQALAQALAGIPKYRDCGIPIQDLPIKEGESR